MSKTKETAFNDIFDKYNCAYNDSGYYVKRHNYMIYVAYFNDLYDKIDCIFRSVEDLDEYCKKFDELVNTLNYNFNLSTQYDNIKIGWIEINIRCRYLLNESKYIYNIGYFASYNNLQELIERLKIMCPQRIKNNDIKIALKD